MVYGLAVLVVRALQIWAIVWPLPKVRTTRQPVVGVGPGAQNLGDRLAVAEGQDDPPAGGGGGGRVRHHDLALESALPRACDHAVDRGAPAAGAGAGRDSDGGREGRGVAGGVMRPYLVAVRGGG